MARLVRWIKGFVRELRHRWVIRVAATYVVEFFRDRGGKPDPKAARATRLNGHTDWSAGTAARHRGPPTGGVATAPERFSCGLP